MDMGRRGLGTAAGIVLGGVILSGAAGLALFLALPDRVQSTMASAPRGQMQSKAAALGFLLWLVPALAVFLLGAVAACTALGPDVLNLRREQAKQFWSTPEHWPAARAHILRTTAVVDAATCVLLVVMTGLDAGERAWRLPGMWWLPFAVAYALVLVWMLRQMLRLEHPDRLGHPDSLDRPDSLDHPDSLPRPVAGCGSAVLPGPGAGGEPSGR